MQFDMGRSVLNLYFVVLVFCILLTVEFTVLKPWDSNPRGR